MKLSHVILVGIILVSANASSKHRAAQKPGRHGSKEKTLHRIRHSVPSVALPGGAFEVGPTVISPGNYHDPAQYFGPGGQEGFNAVHGHVQGNQDSPNCTHGHGEGSINAGHEYEQGSQTGISGGSHGQSLGNQDGSTWSHGHGEGSTDGINVVHGFEQGSETGISGSHGQGQVSQDGSTWSYGHGEGSVGMNVGHGHGEAIIDDINAGHGHYQGSQTGVSGTHGNVHESDYAENVWFVRVLLQKVSTIVLGTLSSYPGLAVYPASNFQLVSEVKGYPVFYISQDDLSAQYLLHNKISSILMSEAFIKGDGCYRYELGAKDTRCRKAWLIGQTHPIDKNTDQYKLGYEAVIKKMPALANVQHEKFILIKMDVVAVFIERMNGKPKELSVVDYFHANPSPGYSFKHH